MTVPDSFYVVLPSNASMKTFADNSQNKFKVKLDTALPLEDGKWSVGLTEIQYPKTWRNLTDGYIEVLTTAERPQKFNFHNGYYPTVDALLRSAHDIFVNARMEKKVFMHHDKTRNRVLIKVNEPISFKFSTNVMNMLGFSGKVDVFSSGFYTSDAPDISEGFSSLFVYSDIVENRLVGDVMVPLLRVVPVRGSPSDPQNIQWESFKHVQYIPVNRTRADTIEVNISRDNGQSVPFESGKVVLTLHFKKTLA